MSGTCYLPQAFVLCYGTVFSASGIFSAFQFYDYCSQTLESNFSRLVCPNLRAASTQGSDDRNLPKYRGSQILRNDCLFHHPRHRRQLQQQLVTGCCCSSSRCRANGPAQVPLTFHRGARCLWHGRYSCVSVSQSQHQPSRVFAQKRASLRGMYQ